MAQSPAPRGNGKPTSKYATLNVLRSGQGMSVKQVSGELLRDAISHVTDAGDAIIIGRTLDGGALMVRVLSGGDNTCWYPSDASELQELLQALVEC